MVPLHELLSRIYWDPEFGRGELRIGYVDHLRDELVYLSTKCGGKKTASSASR